MKLTILLSKLLPNMCITTHKNAMKVSVSLESIYWIFANF